MCRVLLDKLRVLQLFKRIPSLYGTRKLTIGFTRACHLSCMDQINPVHELPNYFFKINFNIISNICLLLLLLALQPTVGFSLLSDSLQFRPFLTQLSPPSYSHPLYIFFNVLNPPFPWSSSDSPAYWFPL
jgi:hypothetical protein